MKRANGLPFDKVRLRAATPELCKEGEEIPIQQIDPAGSTSTTGPPAGSSGAPTGSSSNAKKKGANAKGKGKEKAADDDDYQPEPEEAPPSPKASKKGRKKKADAQPEGGEDEAEEKGKLKESAWALTPELNRGALGPWILNIEDLYALKDDKGVLSTADVWRYIEMHGIPANPPPLFNPVSTSFI